MFDTSLIYFDIITFELSFFRAVDIFFSFINNVKLALRLQLLEISYFLIFRIDESVGINCSFVLRQKLRRRYGARYKWFKGWCQAINIYSIGILSRQIPYTEVPVKFTVWVFYAKIYYFRRWKTIHL